MVMQNRILIDLNAYLQLLDLRVKLMNPKSKTTVKKGNVTKRKIVKFYRNNDCWPSRLSDDPREVKLAQKFENFICPSVQSYDPELRRIVMSSGRKSNNKRKHNVKGFKEEIITFLKEHGRVPSTSYSYQKSPGEARLRHKLDYYTQEGNDTTLLGIIYQHDKCHKSGIPSKYRKLINENIDLEKPLVRLVKD